MAAVPTSAAAGRTRIAPTQLIAQVRSTAPWLIAGIAPPAPPLHALAVQARGFRSILAGWADWSGEGAAPDDSAPGYFALCLAAHHGTVASFVPTDVDASIRGVLWAGATPALRPQLWTIASQASRWDVAGISARVVASADGPVSGHDGEHLSIAAGAWGFLLDDAHPLAAEAEARIDAELQREARTFDRAAQQDESDALRLAWILTHNVGDVDQGLSYWKDPARPEAARFARLAHAQPTAYGGSFRRAAAIYKAVLAAEGHRHYPLRQARCLRRHADLLLPLGPGLDAWGRAVGGHAKLSEADKADVLACLIDGWRTVSGQAGYQRAIAGLLDAAPGGAARLERHLPASARKSLADARLRKDLAVSEASFTASLGKRFRLALAACG